MASVLIATGLADQALWTWREYKKFVHGVNGTDNVLYDTVSNAAYPGVVANPTTAPTGTADTDPGNPSGAYKLYVSYLITWPNGQQYETGLSDAGDVTITGSHAILWADIPICSYDAYESGTTPTIHRKLYRGPGTGGTLGDIYYVHTIQDNTTETYEDNYSNAQLAAFGSCTVVDYEPISVSPHLLEYHYGRLHYVSTSAANQHKLFYSELAAGDTAAETEALIPLSFPADNWDDMRTSGGGDMAITGLVSWGMYLFIASRTGWVRRQGNDPETWSYKKCWATTGVVAPHTIKLCNRPSGLLGLSIAASGMVGISLFDGENSNIVTSPALNKLFDDELNREYIHTCQAEWDGQNYHLLYPSGASTVPDKWVVLDFLRYPEIRIGKWTGLSAQSLAVYMGATTGTLTSGYGLFVGGTDGYVRYHTKDTAELIDIDVKTRDLVGGGPEFSLVRKSFSKIKYALNSGGDTVNLEFYIDSVLQTWPDDTTSVAITGTGDAPQVIEGLPNNWEGYKYSIRLTGTELTTFELFSPWQVEFDLTT